MFQKFLIILLLTISLISCSKKNEVEYEPSLKIDPYNVYKEGIEAFEEGNYFYAEKKFSEAELNFEIVEFAAKAAIMASYALYGINFYIHFIKVLHLWIETFSTQSSIISATTFFIDILTLR
mgnify:CR=1 FL=1